MQSFSILIIDDQPLIDDSMTQAAKTSFPEARFTQVSTFVTAQEHLENLAEKSPKLILLTIDLDENPDRLSLLRLLQDHPQGRLLPIIVLSTSKTDLLVTQAYQLGASAFTQKPVDYEGWKTYLGSMRQYWCETVTLPKIGR